MHGNNSSDNNFGGGTGGTPKSSQSRIKTPRNLSSTPNKKLNDERDELEKVFPKFKDTLQRFFINIQRKTHKNGGVSAMTERDAVDLNSTRRFLCGQIDLLNSMLTDIEKFKPTAEPPISCWFEYIIDKPVQNTENITHPDPNLTQPKPTQADEPIAGGSGAKKSKPNSDGGNSSEGHNLNANASQGVALNTQPDLQVNSTPDGNAFDRQMIGGSGVNTYNAVSGNSFSRYNVNASPSQGVAPVINHDQANNRTLPNYFNHPNNSQNTTAYQNLTQDQIMHIQPNSMGMNYVPHQQHQGNDGNDNSSYY